jgi:pimeloyl-ACP methyl ester carboxylesterase
MTRRFGNPGNVAVDHLAQALVGQMILDCLASSELAPVLLIQGGLGHGDVWGFQVPALAESHQVIVADSRGHGRSTRSEQPFGCQLMADDYLALCRR